MSSFLDFARPSIRYRTMSNSEKPLVFITYSHDSEEHKQQVRALALRLKKYVRCELDQFQGPGPAIGWTRWTKDMLAQAVFTIVVCTENYKRMFDNGHQLTDMDRQR